VFLLVGGRVEGQARNGLDEPLGQVRIGRHAGPR
jgi:hypothetical protein